MKDQLRISNISKRFGGLMAIDQVTVNFRPGRITALIGPNGAGKTTLFNMMTGIIKPDHGSIMLGDVSLAALNPSRIAAQGVGRLFQDVRVFKNMTVIENIMLGFQQQRGEGLFNLLLQPFFILTQQRQFRGVAESIIARIGLSEYSNMPAGSLSFGQQKLVAIGRLLAAAPKVVLLDEPTSGISPQMAVEILNIVREFAVKGKIVIIIEHNMPIVADVADWVVFLNNGKMTAFGSPHEVLGDVNIRRTYVGM